jgi:hypothetical protein
MKLFCYNYNVLYARNLLLFFLLTYTLAVSGKTLSTVSIFTMSYSPFPSRNSAQFLLFKDGNKNTSGSSKGGYGLEYTYLYTSRYGAIGVRTGYKTVYFKSNIYNLGIIENKDDIKTLALSMIARNPAIIIYLGGSIGYAFHEISNLSLPSGFKQHGYTAKIDVGFSVGRFDLFISLETYELGNGYELDGASINLQTHFF